MAGEMADGCFRCRLSGISRGAANRYSRECVQKGELEELVEGARQQVQMTERGRCCKRFHLCRYLVSSVPLYTLASHRREERVFPTQRSGEPIIGRTHFAVFARAHGSTKIVTYLKFVADCVRTSVKLSRTFRPSQSAGWSGNCR